jgi:hypothetical protein
MAFPYKLAEISLLIAFYGLVFLVVNTVHFQFLPVRVVLYDAVLDVGVAGAIVLGLYTYVLRRRLTLSTTETALTLTVGALLGIIVAITVPAIIDRSLSIYILEKIDQRGGGIRQASFDRVFKEEYFVEHRLIDIRLTEQVNSGTIRIKDGCVLLTDRGRRIVAFTRFYRTRLLPKRREIMGQLTDDLTDPFRKSATTMNYECAAK